MQYAQYKKGGEGTLKHYTEQTLMGFEWKMVLSIMGTILAFLEGFYGELMWGFLALFVLDSITGVMKSKKNDVPITSKRLRGAVTKLGAYMVLITALIITSKFESSFVPIVTVAYYYFIFTELKSIFENVEQMGVRVPEFIKGTVLQRLDDIDSRQVASENSIVDNSSRMDVMDNVQSENSTRMDSMDVNHVENVTRMNSMDTIHSENSTRMDDMDISHIENVIRMDDMDTTQSENVTRMDDMDTQNTSNDPSTIIVNNQIRVLPSEEEER